MNRTYLTFFILIMSPSILHADQPPFDVSDPAISENFRNIYQLMDVHNHSGTDSSVLSVFRSSGSGSLLDGWRVYAGSVTVSAGATVGVALVGLNQILYTMATHLETSSMTCTVQQWVSSFTLTNTSAADSKKMNWWILGK